MVEKLSNQPPITTQVNQSVDSNSKNNIPNKIEQVGPPIIQLNGVVDEPSSVDKQIHSFKIRIENDSFPLANKVLEDQDPNLIPAPYFHVKDKSYFINIKIQSLMLKDKVEKASDNINNLYHYSKLCLLVAEALRDRVICLSNETILQNNLQGQIVALKSATTCSKKIRQLDPLDPGSYYIDSLILEYKGVNCTKIDEVLELVKLLTLADALSVNNKEISDNFINAVSYINKRWLNLHQGKKIDNKTLEKYRQQLSNITDDEYPLKQMFNTNIHLFGCASAELVTKYPYIKNKNLFLKQFPDSAHFELPKNLNDIKALKKSLIDQKNTLAEFFNLIGYQEGFMTPDIAKVFLDQWSDKQVIAFASKKDLTTFVVAHKTHKYKSYPVVGEEKTFIDKQIYVVKLDNFKK